MKNHQTVGKRKVVFYGRVSTEHEEQTYALGNQMQWYEELKKNYPNWVIIERYVDDGITGTQAKKRPEFMRMIDDAKMGKFDLIVTREVARFARNTVECLEITKQLDLSSFEMSDHDITLMSYALNCIATISDATEQRIVKKYILEMIDMYQATAHTYRHNDILNVYQTSETQALLQRELILGDRHTDIVLSILFDEIDFSKFNSQTIEYYQEVFGVLLSFYFDAHNNKADRSKCEDIIYKLEEKIIGVSSKNVKEELYKSLIFALTRSGGIGDWSKCQSSYS